MFGMEVNRLYYIEINDTICKKTFDKLASFITAEKLDRIRQFRFDADKKLSLYSEVLIRAIICSILNIRNSEIVFEKNEYGKPFLKDHPDFHYNLSHTRNAIAAAVSDRPVGVDIEKIKKADLRLAKRFFSPGENDYITKDGADTDKHFTEVWTRKEAYVKYTGKGLSLPLNSFDVFGDELQQKITTIEKDGYIISVCTGSENQKFDIIGLPESYFENGIFEIL